MLLLLYLYVHYCVKKTTFLTFFCFSIKKDDFFIKINFYEKKSSNKIGETVNYLLLYSVLSLLLRIEHKKKLKTEKNREARIKEVSAWT